MTYRNEHRTKIVRGFALLAITLIAGGIAVAQPQTLEAQQAIQRQVAYFKAPFIKGYDKSGPGETIVYHSAN